jgi:hypothetical protein
VPGNNNLDQILRNTYTDEIARLTTRQVNPAIFWQREYLGEWVDDEIQRMPENTTWRINPEPLRYQDDATEIRLRSYTNTIMNLPGHTWIISDIGTESGVINIVPEFNEAWIRANTSERYRHACLCGDCLDNRGEAKAKYDKLYGRKTVPNWTAQWANIALAHAAAIFCLEVIYDGKEGKIVNADAIRSAAGL